MRTSTCNLLPICKPKLLEYRRLAPGCSLVCNIGLGPCSCRFRREQNLLLKHTSTFTVSAHEPMKIEFVLSPTHHTGRDGPQSYAAGEDSALQMRHTQGCHSTHLSSSTCMPCSRVWALWGRKCSSKYGPLYEYLRDATLESSAA